MKPAPASPTTKPCRWCTGEIARSARYCVNCGQWQTRLSHPLVNTALLTLGLPLLAFFATRWLADREHLNELKAASVREFYDAFAELSAATDALTLPCGTTESTRPCEQELSLRLYRHDVSMSRLAWLAGRSFGLSGETRRGLDDLKRFYWEGETSWSARVRPIMLARATAGGAPGRLEALVAELNDKRKDVLCRARRDFIAIVEPGDDGTYQSWCDRQLAADAGR